MAQQMLIHTPIKHCHSLIKEVELLEYFPWKIHRQTQEAVMHELGNQMGERQDGGRGSGCGC